MNQANVIISIHNNNEIAFRFQKIPRHQFAGYLESIKLLFPNMKWDPKCKQWILSISEFKALYEICRFLFSAAKIDIVSGNYKSSSSVAQLPLFG